MHLIRSSNSYFVSKAKFTGIPKTSLWGISLTLYVDTAGIAPSVEMEQNPATVKPTVSTPASDKDKQVICLKSGRGRFIAHSIFEISAEGVAQIFPPAGSLNN